MCRMRQARFIDILNSAACGRVIRRLSLRAMTPRIAKLMIVRRRELKIAPLWAGGLAIIMAFAAMPAQSQLSSPQVVARGSNDTAKLFQSLFRSPAAAVV